MQSREEKRDSGQIAKRDNKDLMGFAQKAPKEEMARKPDWIRVKAPVSKGYYETKELLNKKKLTKINNFYSFTGNRSWILKHLRRTRSPLG